MAIRDTLSGAVRYARMSLARATIREVDDNNLWQVIKQADVHKNESPTNFERLQMVGLSSVPMKQKEDQGGGMSGGGGSSGGGGASGVWDNQQPQGEAAEAIILYLNGDREHPVALVGDRRVRPYKAKKGSTILYAADGSEQMVYIKDDGMHIISLDGGTPFEKSEKKRKLHVGHVKKELQTHKIEGKQSGGGQGQQQSQGGDQDHPHEGKIYHVTRYSKGKIEHYTGDGNGKETKVAEYDKDSKTWSFPKSDEHQKFIAEPEKTFDVATAAATIKGDQKVDLQGGRIIHKGGRMVPPFIVA